MIGDNGKSTISTFELNGDTAIVDDAPGGCKAAVTDKVIHVWLDRNSMTSISFPLDKIGTLRDVLNKALEVTAVPA
jgi:hypothetical protein